MTALKTVRGSSSNKVLSLYTTCSSSQSRETVPLNGKRPVSASSYKTMWLIRCHGAPAANSIYSNSVSSLYVGIVLT